jgi:hypothetical protein
MDELIWWSARLILFDSERTTFSSSSLSGVERFLALGEFGGFTE